MIRNECLKLGIQPGTDQIWGLSMDRSMILVLICRPATSPLVISLLLHGTHMDPSLLFFGDSSYIQAIHQGGCTASRLPDRFHSAVLDLERQRDKHRLSAAGQL